MAQLRSPVAAGNGSCSSTPASLRVRSRCTDDVLRSMIVALDIRLDSNDPQDRSPRPSHHTSIFSGSDVSSPRRGIPGSCPAPYSLPIMAASIGKVPLPQNGSTRIRSLIPRSQHDEGRRQRLRRSAPYLSGCCNRAYAGILRSCQALPSPCPCEGIRAAGKLAPLSGNHSDTHMPCFIRSTMAFFMMDWISDGLKSLLLMEEAFATQKRRILRDDIPPTGVALGPLEQLLEMSSALKAAYL